MKAIKNFLIAFDIDDMSRFGKLKMNNTFLEVTTTYHPAEYSVEVAYLVDVPRREKFFKKGDKVLVMYDVFIRGKYPMLAKGEAVRKIGFGHDLEVKEADKEVYWANTFEVLAKFVGDDEIVSVPGRILVKKPEVQKKKYTGTIIIPDSASVNDEINIIKKDFWAEVAYDSIPKEPFISGVKKGDNILIMAAMFTPLTFGGLLSVYEDSIIAKK